MKMNVNWKTMLVAGLTVCLAVSLFFNGYLYYELTRPTEHQSPTFFSFVWSSEREQNITEGPLYINMTFERIGENLSVIIKINDDDYNVMDSYGGEKPDALFIVFDSYANDTTGSINLNDTFYYYLLRPDNTTTEGPRLFLDCQLNPHIFMSGLSSFKLSDFHTCTFKPNEGYMFNCTFPIYGKWREIHSDVVTLRYMDVAGSVYIPPFHFGVDVT
jgi:hypothetical protein